MEIIQLKDFVITRIQGGMREFEKTGKYPDYLHFYSSHYRRRWKQRCVSDDQTGTIRYKGEVIFEYRLTDTACTGRAILGGEAVSEWEDIKMEHRLQD